MDRVPVGYPHQGLPNQRSTEVSDFGDCSRNVINHDVVTAIGTDLAAEDEEVIVFMILLPAPTS